MRKTLAPVLVAVLVVYAAQQLLMPILAPLSRELSLTETQLGWVVTIAALALTLAAPLWGKVVDHHGTRAAILPGLALATIGLAGFAVAAAAGLDGRTGTGTTFVLILLTRSLIFGIGIAAIPVAALAAAGASTTTEADRTRATGMVGAAQGVSMVLGPAAGGALAVVSLKLPLYVAPALTALVLLWAFLTSPRVKPASDRPAARGVRPWDARVLPLLAIGFLLYLSLSLVQVVIGFIVADRLGLGSEETAGAVGVALAGAGVALVGTQGALVPKLGWPPRRLLLTGIPIALAAYGVLLVAGQLWSLAVAFTLLGFGLGVAIPGFTAAPTLVVDRDQQGAIAGLVSATIGATFVVGPIAGTALYRVQELAPVIASLVAAGLALLLTSRAPRSVPVVEPVPTV